MRHAARRDSHLEIDPFRQMQPMQCCKGVSDVVVTTQLIYQMSRSVKNGLKMPLLVSRKPNQDKIAIVESHVYK